MTETETNGEEETEQEAEWIDVLVEMLLNLFTINKNWIRNAIKTQFKKLMPRLTVNSVKLIIDVGLDSFKIDQDINYLFI